MKPSNPSNKHRLTISVTSHGTHLVTRSQAKQIAAVIGNHNEVELDFVGVEKIGQGFADELLRVWPLAHAEMRVIVTGANEAVKRMAEHVWNRADLPQPGNAALRQGGHRPVAKHLFLDIDGVLHPASACDEPIGSPALFVKAEVLAEALAGSRVQIVLSSSWRQQETLPGLCALIPSLAPLIVGVTPKLNGHPRHDEIQTYLRTKRCRSCAWLAVDDNPKMYPAGCQQLVICDSTIGLQPEQLDRIRRWAIAG